MIASSGQPAFGLENLAQRLFVSNNRSPKIYVALPATGRIDGIA